MSHQAAAKSKINALEGLRGLMACWVVLGHLSLTVGWNLPLIDRNTLPVDVFILLSGFVIALLIDRKRESYGPYITRRAFRIFPLYLVVLAVSALLLPVQLDAWQSIPFDTDANTKRLELARIADQNFTAHLLTHIPLLQGIIPSKLLTFAPWTLVGQAWSVSLEWQFYLIAPLLAWVFKTPGRAVPGTLAMLALSIASRWLSPAFIGSHIWHFGLGMATHAFVAASAPQQRRFQGALMALFSGLLLFKYGAWQLVPLAIWLLALGCILSPLGIFNVPNRLLGSAPAVRLGELSYSIYLVHMVPLFVGAFLLNQLNLNKITYSSLLAVFVTILTYGISVLAHKFIEKPGIRYGALLSEDRSPPARPRTASTS